MGILNTFLKFYKRKEVDEQQILMEELIKKINQFNLKIFVYDLPKKYQQPMPFSYPISDTTPNLEELFIDIINKSNLITDNPNDADLFFIPIMFCGTFASLNNGNPSTDFIKEFNEHINNLKYWKTKNEKHFIICQWANGTLFDTKNAIVLHTSANKTNNHISLPLPTTPHIEKNIKKKYIASFIGLTKFANKNIVRENMLKILKNTAGFELIDGNKKKRSVKKFRELMYKSKFSLCPRGYGPSSYRLFEALQLGIPPVIISDEFIPPFQDKIDWKSISIRVDENKMSEIPQILNSITDYEYAMFVSKGKQAWKKYFSKDACILQIMEILKSKNESTF